MSYAINFYWERINTYKRSLQRLNRILHYLMITRSILFILILFSIFILFKEHNSLFLLLFILISFFTTIVYTHINNRKIRVISLKIRFCEIELDFINMKYENHFSGYEFASLNTDFNSDFNIVGKNSLFQYLNRCYTYFARKKLADNLLNFNHEKKDIILKQKAIKSLQQNQD